MTVAYFYVFIPGSFRVIQKIAFAKLCKSYHEVNLLTSTLNGKSWKRKGELLKMESLENEKRFLSKLKSIFIFLRTFFFVKFRK